MAEGPIANLLGSSQQAGTKIPQHVLVVDASGNPATFGGSGGTSATDSGTFTATSTLGTPVMGAYESTPDQLTSGQLGIIGLDIDRNVKVNVVAGGTAGVQYTQGDTDATITGTAVMFESNTTTSALNAVSSAAPLPVQLGDGTDLATVRDVTGAKALDVSIVDASGNQITSFGGGTQYTEDAAAASDPVGNALIARRRDTLSSEVSTDGDNVALNATAKGEVYVKHVDSVPVTDNSGSLTVDAPVGTPVFVRLSDGAAAISTLPVSLASVPSHAVTNAGTFAVQESGAALTALQLIDNLVLAEDAAHVTGDPGVQMPTVRTDTASARAGTDGDYQPLITDASGRLHVNVGNAVPVTDNSGSLTVDNAGTFAVQAAQSGTWNVGTVTTITNAVTAVGSAAHDAAVSGNPVLIAAEGRSSDGTAVTSGDVVRLLATLLGKAVTYAWALPGSTWSYAAASGGITNTTGVTVKTAAGAGIRNYVTDIQVINGHASTGTDVQLRDGASGTVLWRGYAQPAGGGCAAHFDTPIRGSANTLLEVACGTTGTATYVNVQGFTSAE